MSLKCVTACVTLWLIKSAHFSPNLQGIFCTKIPIWSPSISMYNTRVHLVLIMVDCPQDWPSCHYFPKAPTKRESLPTVSMQSACSGIASTMTDQNKASINLKIKTSWELLPIKVLEVADLVDGRLLCIFIWTNSYYIYQKSNCWRN